MKKAKRMKQVPRGYTRWRILVWQKDAAGKKHFSHVFLTELKKV